MLENEKLQELSKICAIIVSYNPDDKIKLLYESIKKRVNYTIIIDNNSNSMSKSIIMDLLNKNNELLIIERPTNEGIAKALNIGINKAIELGFKWGITFDQDSIPNKSMIDIMVSDYLTCDDGKVSIVAPKFIDQRFNKKTKHIAKPIEYKDVVITSGNLINFKIIKDIGMFDENLFIDSVDFDICLRNKLHGYKIIQSNNAYMNHSLGEKEIINLFNFKIEINKHSYIRKYYITRNHLYIIKKYYKKFPFFCLKKNIFFIKFILQSLIIEKNRLKNKDYIKRGIIDYKNSNYGKIDLKV